MWISKIYSSIAAISLLSVASAPQVWAQESGGEVESFNRSLGLEGMGTDLASVEHELEHGSPANTPENSKTENPKKGPVRFSRLNRSPTSRSIRTQWLRIRSAPFICRM
ncbi:MAG TPA: hypothetical protein VF020_16105 [Chthoniobacterales bacterium]